MPATPPGKAGPTVLDPQHDIRSYTDDELAGMSVLELRQLSLAAEEQAWAVYFEHEDETGAVPEDARRRAEELSAMAERYRLMGRELLRRRAKEAEID
jgi:hypothetical protein